MEFERYLCREACEICKKPVYADEGYHSVSLNHSSCLSGARKEFEEASKKMAEILGEFGIKPKRKRAREGTGKIAQKCLKMATEAFEREAGVKVTHARIWNQQGGHRGPHWDLAAWGVNFDFLTESGNTARGSISSWSKMTAVSKMKILELSATDIPYMYEN